MKSSGFKSIYHIYLAFFILLVVIFSVGISMLLYNITLQNPVGQTVLSNWPIHFTHDFSKEIFFAGDTPEVKQTGLEKLQKNHLWLQIIDTNGNEVYSYNKPTKLPTHYSPTELLILYQDGIEDYSAFLGNIRYDGTDWTYIIGFPTKISKVTMYFNDHRFTSGKPILITLAGVAFLLVIVLGLIYSLWLTKQMSHMAKAIRQIASRTYTPVMNNGAFRDIFIRLNALDSEIRASDEARVRNEKLREEWIANITHDLKTPLSPIRGYAELISNLADAIEPDEIRRYGNTILKNTAYAEELIDDLKLTYQLQNEMIPVNKCKQNIVRFVKELIIDVLNDPEYESRHISFHCAIEGVMLQFDAVLLKRALSNLLINALVHNSKETEISVLIKAEENMQIIIQDNGKGISKEELSNLFTRYYRGTNTKAKPEGTGLGMAIAKQIIELHGGSIALESEMGIGTNIIIEFPIT